MNRIFLTVICAILLTNYECVPPPQVPTQVLLVDVRSSNCSTVEGFLNYENDTIRVAYIFWAEDGIMGIFIHNKLTKPLYVDWKKCSYITGTIKHDYWDEAVTIEQSGSSASSSSSYSQNQTTTSESGRTALSLESQSQYWKNFWSPNISSETRSSGEATTASNTKTTSYGLTQYLESTFTYSMTRITKPERITFIPPRTTISPALFTISENPIKDIPPNKFLAKDTTFQDIADAKHVQHIEKYRGETYHLDSLAPGPLIVHLSSVGFDEKTSPLLFRSFITYSTDEHFLSEAYLDARFYIARITQIPLSAFNATRNENNRNIWASPSTFYVFKKPFSNRP